MNDVITGDSHSLGNVFVTLEALKGFAFLICVLSVSLESKPLQARIQGVGQGGHGRPGGREVPPTDRGL